jgi:exodeoxyribonuclease VII small subunit
MAESKNAIKYEEALAQLEELVNKMENGDVSIDSLSENLKKAQKLIKLCKDKLMKTEEEIKNLKVEDEKN